MADPVDLTTHEIDAAIGTAFERGRTVVVGYVDDDGYPTLSFRGSAHVHSPTQLAIWARKRDDGLAVAIARRPKVSVLYHSGGQGPGPRFLSLRGTARLDEAAGEAVYAAIPQREREHDAERAGVAVIVDVRSVRGFGADGPFEMAA
ncbi:MAG TPA: pyridoxamine 5'-phosphate oxidase family protein [Solirubrobacteraceae bacterium]|nr:pyridoxamine 5'-phosphate oxidase family protein [Solirubrobacteraceae bacterium]